MSSSFGSRIHSRARYSCVMPKSYDLIGQRTRSAREAAGLSQQQVATLLEVPVKWVKEYEDDRRDIREREFLTLCRTLRQPPIFFLQQE